MLAIVLLSAALPGLVCLAPTHPADCCLQMMQECGSSMATLDASCCKMRSTDTSMPPTPLSQTQINGISSHLVVASFLMAPRLSDVSLTSLADTAHCLATSGRSSILRI